MEAPWLRCSRCLRGPRCSPSPSPPRRTSSFGFASSATACAPRARWRCIFAQAPKVSTWWECDIDLPPQRHLDSGTRRVRTLLGQAGARPNGSPHGRELLHRSLRSNAGRRSLRSRPRVGDCRRRAPPGRLYAGLRAGSPHRSLHAEPHRPRRADFPREHVSSAVGAHPPLGLPSHGPLGSRWQRHRSRKSSARPQRSELRRHRRHRSRGSLEVGRGGQ